MYVQDIIFDSISIFIDILTTKEARENDKLKGSPYMPLHFTESCSINIEYEYILIKKNHNIAYYFFEYGPLSVSVTKSTSLVFESIFLGFENASVIVSPHIIAICFIKTNSSEISTGSILKVHLLTDELSVTKKQFI